MSSERRDRRNLIDRLPLSEFFAMICTGLLLLTLFLLSSVRDHHTQSQTTMSAGAGITVKPFPLQEPEVLTDEPTPNREKARLPTRELNDH